MPMSIKEWKAREDARILADAERVKRSPERLKEAKGAAGSVKGIGSQILQRVRNVRPNINRSATRSRKINRSAIDENPFNIFKKI